MKQYVMTHSGKVSTFSLADTPKQCEQPFLEGMTLMFPDYELNLQDYYNMGYTIMRVSV